MRERRSEMKRATLSSGIRADVGSRFRAQRAQVVAVIVSLVVLAVLPAMTSHAVLAVVSTDLIFLQLCYSWNLVGGFLGELSLGHMIFWAIGSFGIIFALNNHLPVIPVVIGLALVGAVVGVGMALSIRLAKLEGLLYVAIFTLILGVLIQSIAENWSVLGASVGVVSVPLAGIGPLGQYEIVLLLAAVAVLANIFIALSSRGARWRALRDDPGAAETCGISITRERSAGYALSAVLCVLGGAFQGYYLGSASGKVSLDVTVLITVSLAVFVGGPGTILGPLAGWIVIYGLGSVVTSMSTSINASLYSQILEFGAALVALRLIVPRLGNRDLLSGIANSLRRSLRPGVDHDEPVAAPKQGSDVRTSLGALRGQPDSAEASAGVGAVASSALRASPPLIVEQVRKSFGNVEVLRGVTFQVEPGEVVGLLGANGAGKSTLCNILSGLLNVDGGSVRVGERELSCLAPAARAAFGVGRSFQTPRLFPTLSLSENLAVVSGISQTATAEILQGARVQTADGRASSQTEFFGRRLTEVVRAAAMGKEILLLDEPLAGLSEDEHALVLQLARAAAEQGSRVVIVEHLVPVIAPVVDRLVVLGDGVVIADGPARQVLVNPQVVESYLGSAVVVNA